MPGRALSRPTIRFIQPDFGENVLPQRLLAQCEWTSPVLSLVAIELKS